MYLSYEEAFQTGIAAYRTLQYSDSCLSAFRIACKEFKKYMEDTGLPYSRDLAQCWVNENKDRWKTHKFKSSRKAMSVLADIIEHGRVTTSLKTIIARTPAYIQLPNWSRTILDDYLATLSCTYGTAYLTLVRNACSRFFLFLESRAISQTSEITHGIVKFFFTEDVHISSKSKDQCNNAIRHCLMYMADQGLIPKTIGLALNKFVIPNLIIVLKLPEPDRNRFMRFFNPIKNDASQSKVDYDRAAKQLSDLHKGQRYSPFIQKLDLQATKDFSVFMDANSFAYSNDLALEWLEFNKAKWPRIKYLTYRRVLLSINEILCTGGLATSCFLHKTSKYSLPGWANNLLSQYLQEREREGCARSTLDMTRCSCSRFLGFLDRYGTASEKRITPEAIKDFQAQDVHKTVAGKNAYAIRIRGFLRFLARKGLVSETLELAVSTKMAPCTSIVTTLTDSQIDAIYTFRQNVHRPIELRNAAIIMLGLRMGLRASDISNLKLVDISWKESSISLIQQKTGVYLKLPFPIDVGNSLYLYIRGGRPQSNSHHIFLHHRAPYCRLKRGTFSRILQAVIAAKGENETVHGFHVTRKTFASKLLATGNPVTTIAAALGHVGVDTVDEYLATNEEQMRLCAISLTGIEYSGGFNL